MNTYLGTIGWLRPLLGKLDAVDRFNAARDSFSLSGEGLWVWMAVILALLGVVTGVLVYVALRRRKPVKAARSAFERRADQADLTPEERSLLTSIAALAGLRWTHSVFTNSAAFHKGFAALVQSGRLAEMSAQGRADTFAQFESLRRKLQFPKAPEVEPTGPVSTWQLPVGTKLKLSKKDSPAESGAVAKRIGSRGLEVEPEVPLVCQPGDICAVRFDVDGKMWEFDAPVVQNRHEKIILGHSEQVRFHDRRRFPRVATSKPARVARWPFVKDGAGGEEPGFDSANVVEMAGPGLKLEGPMQLREGDRVLLVLHLGDDKSIQGVGVVRRAYESEHGESGFVVELIGLKPTELAELTHETDKAAGETVAPREAPMPEPSGAASSQEGRE